MKSHTTTNDIFRIEETFVCMFTVTWDNLSQSLVSTGQSSWVDQQKLLQVKDQGNTIGVCTLPHPASSRCWSSHVDHWSTVHPRTSWSDPCCRWVAVKLLAGYFWIMSDWDLVQCLQRLSFSEKCFQIVSWLAVW